MKELDALKSLSVNVDSETARQIAVSYIHWKYFDSILACICMMAFVALLYFAIKTIAQGLKQ